MTETTNTRKLDHLRILQDDAGTDRQAGYFDAIRLSHRALPQLNLSDIDPSIEFLGKSLSFPLLISSMTGGDDELLLKINRNLAIAAEACGVAMAVGSQRVMFTHPQAVNSFALREFAPNGLLIANLGAVQLNNGFAAEHCQQAIDALGADAIYLHLNPLQEVIQPEGDTNFAGLAERIGDIAGNLEVPVILKEVGAGLSVADIQLGLQQGIGHFDLAGTGGTSWSRIEHHRQAGSESHELGILFQDWGIPTPQALKMAQPYMDEAKFIASGGLRNGVDMVKSVILGGSLCGMAAPLLKPAMESPQAVIQVIEQLRQEFVTAMFLLGQSSVAELHLNKTLLLDEH